MEQRPVLLTVSGSIDPTLRVEIADGRKPRADYFALADAFGADLLDHTAAERRSGLVGRLIHRVAGAHAELAWACFRQRRQREVIVTDGEQVGIPLAALLLLSRHRPGHVMIGHVLSSRKKAWLHRMLRLQRRIDVLVVYASAQRRFAIERLGYFSQRVVQTPFMVDTDFWDPRRVTPEQRRRPLVCAVGMEFRDYPTFIDAIRNLDVDVVVAASSPWSKRADSSAGLDLPPNVVVTSVTPFELRQLYADSVLVVVPLRETDFQAGITTILEAMSMARAVVCSRTSGQTDTIVDGLNGVYVPPHDVAALRHAIEQLVAAPATAARMGQSGRQWVREHADLEVYVRRLSPLVRSQVCSVPERGDSLTTSGSEQRSTERAPCGAGRRWGRRRSGQPFG
jgi:glycosyltransferase involved in cell wall biosynthesis